MPDIRPYFLSGKQPIEWRRMQKTKNPDCFDISIVIVAYNNESIIIQCLGSLFAALEQYRCQLTIIDNASSDATVPLIEKACAAFHSRDNHFEIIANRENKGFTKALNQGLEKSAGEYILILNPDVIVCQETITMLLPLFERNEKIGVVAPQLRFMNGTVQPSCRNFPRKQDVLFELFGLNRLFSTGTFFNHWRMPDFDHRSSRFVDQVQGAFLLTKQPILKRVGLFDERFFMFFSDVDWCRRVMQNGLHIRFSPESYVLHEKGGSDYKNREKMIVTSHRSLVQYFKKYDRTLSQETLTCVIHFLLLAILLPRILLCKVEKLRRTG